VVLVSSVDNFPWCESPHPLPKNRSGIEIAHGHIACCAVAKACLAACPCVRRTARSGFPFSDLECEPFRAAGECTCCALCARYDVLAVFPRATGAARRRDMQQGVESTATRLFLWYHTTLKRNTCLKPEKVYFG